MKAFTIRVSESLAEAIDSHLQKLGPGMKREPWVRGLILRELGIGGDEVQPADEASGQQPGPRSSADVKRDISPIPRGKA